MTGNLCRDSNKAYLARDTEALLVEAYRLWCWGIIEDRHPRIKEVSSLYERSLGKVEGRLAFDALLNFVNTLGRCSTCPLKTSPLGSKSVCSAEVLFLALLSGLQHGDETVVAICLDEMKLGPSCKEVIMAAEVLAATFRSFAEPLLPVPSHTILAVIADTMPSQTLH